MKYDAIIFDLFGTLIENFGVEQYYTLLAETAVVLSIECEAFVACWIDDEFRRMRRSGMFSGTEAQLEYACTLLGIPVVPEKIAAAKQMQYANYGIPSLVPRAGTLETLIRLKSEGYAIGLVSDCSWEVPELWKQSAFAGIFDATIFSCMTGTKKPDPRIFRMACDELGVAAERCLFIGDGDSLELTATRRLGMDVILICAPHEREMVMQREDPRNWDGPVIERIEEVLAYLQIRENTAQTSD